MISVPIVTVRRASTVPKGAYLSEQKSAAGKPAAQPQRTRGDATAVDDAEERPSRSARKRQAEALQKLGVGLTRMRPAKLRELQQHLHLPEVLFEALLEVHRLRGGPALARQRQYIGRLMRDVDPQPIERALAEFSRSGDAKMAR
jgi:ribosome-associated protein